MTVNGELRQMLKLAVDAKVRELRGPHPGSADGFCSECGGDWKSTTEGCKSCWNRARNHEPIRHQRRLEWRKEQRRLNTAYAERVRAANRERCRRYRAERRALRELAA